MSEQEQAPSPVEALVNGLRKAVAGDFARGEVEWVDANIVRLLLTRYCEATAPDEQILPDPSAWCRWCGVHRSPGGPCSCG